MRVSVIIYILARGSAGHWGKFFEWPSAQSATPFYNEVKVVILRQGRRASGHALASEADPQLPTPRGGPPGNRGPSARRTRAMTSALLPQDIKGYLLSTVTPHTPNLKATSVNLLSMAVLSWGGYTVYVILSIIVCCCYFS